MGTWVMTTCVEQHARLGTDQKTRVCSSCGQTVLGGVQAHLHSLHSQGESQRLLPQGACRSCAGALANPVTVHHMCHAH